MKKNGFTLIELLAVILILGIIALIAVPTVNKMVTEARINAGKRSLDGHIKAIEQGVLENALNDSDFLLNGYYSYNDLNISDDKTKDKVMCDGYVFSNNELTIAYNCEINSTSFCYSKEDGSDVCSGGSITDTLVASRVEEIRNTSNTDVSMRTGNIYYVSNDGNDSNDGLSESKAIKTLNKLQTMFNDKVINAGDSILFRDGDMFRGFLDIAVSDILLGSYGDISKGKPILNRSTVDGTKVGTWTEIKKNIWKYEIDGNNPFDYNVGVIWFSCNEGNDNCSKSMENVNNTFDFSQLVTTYSSFDESNMDDKISALLTKDLQHYHVGHVGSSKTGAGALYLYSTSNPSERFDDIEFAMGANIVHLTRSTDLIVDNIKFVYGGSHGVGTGTVANLKVTNSEFGFIGGAVQHYNNGYATRYGNGIEIYGSIQDSYGYFVKDGFVVDNCYVYQIYDAGLTFQYTTTGSTKMIRTVFSNNVVEYSNYNIEYWNYTSSTDSNVIADSYIDYYEISNNIFRYAGDGVCTTRPNGGWSTHIKTWSHPSGFNILKGEYIIKNNIFDTAVDHFVYLRTNNSIDLPTLVSNTFINFDDTAFGYYATSSQDPAIAYNTNLLSDYFKGNTFIGKNNDVYYDSDSGKSGDTDWTYDASSKTLTISGSGKMDDYSLDNLPPYYKYKDGIKKIVIGEDVTYLGKYAFYDFEMLTEIRIDAKKLDDLAYLSTNVNTGDNFTFYKAGQGWLGIKLIFGSNVTYIPRMLLRPETSTSSPFVTSVVFEGNNIKTVAAYGLSNLSIPALKLPEGITTMSGVSLGYDSKLKVLILPNSLTSLSGWNFASNSNVEKIVFGTSNVKIGSSTFYNNKYLSMLVIPNFAGASFSDTEAEYKKIFYGNATTINSYGNDKLSSFVNSYLEKSGLSNLTYNAIDDYNINVTSSDESISDVKKYDESYSFVTNREFKVYEYYIDKIGTKYIIDEIVPNKNGNNYTISNLRVDIYIDFN